MQYVSFDYLAWVAVAYFVAAFAGAVIHGGGWRSAQPSASGC